MVRERRNSWRGRNGVGSSTRVGKYIHPPLEVSS
jgi:hypothetical protein